MENNVDIEIIRIRQFVREKGWSKLGFAKLIGVTDHTIKRLFEDDFNPTLSTLRRMQSVIPKTYKAKTNRVE